MDFGQIKGIVSSTLKNYRTIIKNTGYLSVIEIVRYILPLVALPYVIKTVGASNYGKIAFAQTIITYIVIFINFGIDISAVRSIALNRNNKDEINIIVSAVLFIKATLYIFISFLFLISLFTIPYLGKFRLLYFFCYLTTIYELLYPSWYFQGVEKMKYMALTRFIPILFYSLSVFIFIHYPSDYIKVPLLQSIGNILSGCVASYFLLFREKISFVWPSFKRIKLEFINSIPFFLSRVSTTLTSGLTKTISGIFFSMEIVAAFDIAQKVANVAIAPIQMFNQAVYPHIAKTQDRKFANKFFYFNVIFSLGIACIILVLTPFIVHYFAKNTIPEAIPILRILTIYIFLGGMVTYIGTPVLVSLGYPKPFNWSVIFSFIVMAVFYAFLYQTHFFDYTAFAFTLVGTELFIFIYRLYFCYSYKIFIKPW